ASHDERAPLGRLVHLVDRRLVDLGPPRDIEPGLVPERDVGDRAGIAVPPFRAGAEGFEPLRKVAGSLDVDVRKVEGVDLGATAGEHPASGNQHPGRTTEITPHRASSPCSRTSSSACPYTRRPRRGPPLRSANSGGALRGRT